MSDTPPPATFLVPQAPAVPLTSFVGREPEIALVTALLVRPDIRLLTLTGPGGIGKTRLALQIAADLAHLFPGGVVVIPLAPIRDRELVPATVAQILGVPDAPEQPLLTRLRTFLHDRHLLLVLDNAEHLIDAAASLVAELLAQCPRLTVLATSRARLGISGERVVPVSGLNPEDASGLFIERAQAVAPTLGASKDTQKIIEAICAGVDRLPLATELAAARTSVLPPRALLNRLQHRLDLLTDGPRDAPTRQRTMRDTIAWSYALLSNEHQALFQHLGVFVGGFTLEAVEAVVDGDVLAGVSALVAASLVNRAEGVAGEPRFTMLETIREYALEWLAASGHEGAARERHATYYLSLAERTNYCEYMSLPEGEIRLAQITADEANVRGALLWYEHEGNYVSIMRMASRLGALWVFRGYTQEGQRWLELALERGASALEMVRAMALATLSSVVNMRGQNSQAVALAEEALTIARSHSESLTTAHCLVLSAVPAYKLRNYDHAVTRFEEATSILSSMDDTDLTQNMLVMVTGQLGQVALLQGNIAEAEALARLALEQEQRRGYAPGESHLLGNFVPSGLGGAARAKGDAATAFGHYRQSLVLARRYRNVRAVLYALSDMAWALAVLAQHSAAARLFGACEAAHVSFGFDSDLEFLDTTRALRLPESWAVAYAPLTKDKDLHRIFGGQHPLPPIPNPEAIAEHWAAGRLLTLDQAVSEALTAQIDAQTPPPAPQSGLTSRELEVLQLLATGKTDAEIAAALFISIRTAATHIRQIYDKLNVSSRAAAAAYAVRHSLD